MEKMTASKGILVVLVLMVVAGCASTPPNFDDAMRDYQTGYRDRAVQKLNWLADHGDAQAATQLGVMYMYGDSLRQDYGRAAPLLLEGAQGGIALAQLDIGYLYEKGWGTKQDYAQAADWYRKAADQGETMAENDLGNLYKTGQGVQQDYAQALVWLRKSADTGNTVAYANLGWMYLNGLGVSKDVDQALAWYTKAAQGGNFKSMLFLASIYEHGYYGVPKDHSKADLLFKQASNHLLSGYDALWDGMRAVIDAHKTYPSDAVKAHIAGTVKLEFDCPYQVATDVRITQSSGNQSLDAAAMDAIKESIFPRRGGAVASLTHFIVELNFTLDANGNPAPGSGG